MTQCDPYPTFARPERLADAVMHVAGVAFSVLVTIIVLIWATHQEIIDTRLIFGLAVYGISMTASFVASSCYHFTPWEHIRPALRRVDHAAIHLKIAGTYTPLVMLVNSTFAYGILAVVWGSAALGVATKLFFWARPTRWGVALYVGMGWLSVALLPSLVPVISALSLTLIVAGGLLYSVGAVLFSIDDLPFQNAIWHGFVLAASACFFAAIILGVFLPP